MTIEELKAEHPALYAQVIKEGSDQGIKAEKDRVGAWMVYVGADAKAVADGIKSGEALSATAAAELGLKALSAAQLAKAESENTDDVTTDPPAGGEGTEEPNAVSDFEKEIDELNAKK